MPASRRLIADPPPWPDGARCAVAFTFDMDADSILHLAQPASAHTRVAALSMLQYGPQVAMPRILALFREFGMAQTFFVPAWCIERYPAVVEAALADGHEIAHHGYLHEHPNELTREQEAHCLRRGIEVIERFTGARPVGYRAPAYQFSASTLELLLEAGFAYDASLMGDDIPYRLTDGRSGLLELPSHYALDDWPQYMYSREFDYRMPIKAPGQAMEVFRAEFDAAWRHGGLWIAVWHPFVSGRPARLEAIADLMGYMAGKGGVWFARLRDIAAHIGRLAAAGDWTPRTERLPQYTGPIPELRDGA